MNATTLRTVLVALLVLGGVTCLLRTESPERAPIPAAAKAGGVCKLGTSC